MRILHRVLCVVTLIIFFFLMVLIKESRDATIPTYVFLLFAVVTAAVGELDRH